MLQQARSSASAAASEKSASDCVTALPYAGQNFARLAANTRIEMCSFVAGSALAKLAASVTISACACLSVMSGFRRPQVNNQRRPL
jgi:hypothetical protein